MTVTSVRPADSDEPTPSESPVPARSARRPVRDLGTVALIGVVLLCGLALVFGFLNKDRCTGPSYDAQGRSEPNYLVRNFSDVCASDIHYLWIGREINNHVFPYVHGGITDDGQLFGGVVEYPVLTGMLIWLGAFFADTDHQFLLASAILLTPFALFSAWAFAKLTRWRALLWVLGPPLVLYAFQNWDLAADACVAGAVYLVYRGWGARGEDRPLLTRATVAAVLLGLGFAIKIYPAILVVPLMLFVATGGPGGRHLRPGKRFDVAGAARIGAAAAGAAVAVNVPFMIAGFEGWRASFTFQALKKVDITTNSIWYWGVRPFFNPVNKQFSDGSDQGFQTMVQIVSPILVLAALATACYVGWRVAGRTGTYPWLGVSAAAICGFILFNKVHSPQYTLWLVPMFVLLRVRWTWIAAFYLADIALGVGLFRWLYQTGFPGGNDGALFDGFAGQATMVGVWGQAVLLVVLPFIFMASRNVVEEDASRKEEVAVTVA